jgi:hypothetical protein
MTTYIAEPYVGALPLKFGMSPDTVAALLGPPRAVFPHPLGGLIEARTNLSLLYTGDSKELLDITISTGASLVFRGVDLFMVEDLIAHLSEFDPDPYEWVGFLIFLQLGFRLAGFHNVNHSQQAIGIVARGYFDPFISQFTPWKGKT